MDRSLGIYNFSRVVPRPFGAANWVTLARAVFALSLLTWALATLLSGAVPMPAWRWVIAMGAVAALCLDGVDGYLARRFENATPFGARFDMETDALTMLALALMVLAAGQVGPWVLSGGLMRYIFVLGGWMWPAFARPLPRCKRRQIACVVQMAALIVTLLPPLSPAGASAICLVGLAFLSYSFGADVVWLARREAVESEARG